MPVFIHDIATAVPETAYRQDFLRDVMLRQFEGRAQTQKLVRRIYDRSGIERRHSVVKDLDGETDTFLLFDREQGALTPGTAARNAVYVEAARRLALDVGHGLLGGAGFRAGDVTHLITVSCTGCAAPGFDYALMRGLGLPASTHRYHVGFMGCFAAFQAMQMADAFCRADPDAVVLAVCVEVCTIHLQLDETPDHLVSGAVFADGAAGFLASARPPERSAGGYRIEALASALSDDGERDMVWTLGDTGFEIGLSRYVPALLASHLAEVLEPLRPLFDDDRDRAQWAVHPGGRAILDKVEDALVLDPAQLAASRHVLARYGNMSSATILFVLRELFDSADDDGAAPVVAMAFGPGLTIESGLLTRLARGRVQ